MLRISEAEESLRFLATIGPRISSSLSLVETVENIRHAMIPQFADKCVLFLGEFPGHSSSFWPADVEADGDLNEALKRAASSTAPLMETSGPMANRLLAVPLSPLRKGFGSIAFALNKDREYTATDVVLAVDLANRAGLSIQNCTLFASEQATRSALIKAEKLATAGRMSAAIAHEINNPLEALTNLIYILEQSPEASTSIRETASAALAEVTRLAHITRQTLGFYRELRAPSDLDLSESVRETLELYKNRLASKTITVVLDLQDGLRIRGIKGEIRQVISNLVVNALESMEQGGQLMICTRTEGDKATLEVEDTGPGIPEALVPHVFEAFFTTKQGTGTGLGLWITHSIVEKHEGTITLETRTALDDHGTTFRLEFPLVRD
jgi:signal transduction histidine kinase